MKICTYPLLVFVKYAQALVFIKYFEFYFNSCLLKLLELGYKYM